MVRNAMRHVAVLGLGALLMLGAGCRRHKYENPIAKDTQQPDKVLFDTAMEDVEKGRYERARLELQTMMNTYDTSEYLAKAKLLVADTWAREGGSHGMAQAEAEYKDFILFYPNMEEAAEAQSKICKMQYQQLEKADRDAMHARLAEAECKDVLLKFPNSKFAPEAAQMLRDVQEVLADREFKVAKYYFNKGGNAFFPAANRFGALVNQYGLYSKAGDALWMQADAYSQLGDKYEGQVADAYTRIVRDYPLNDHAGEAKANLEAMGRPVPEADPIQLQRMQYEKENRTTRGFMSKLWGPFSGRPDMTQAAKSGSPQMDTFRPAIPANIPATAQGVLGTNTVDITQVGQSDVIDKNPDVRSTTGGAEANPAGAAAAGAGAASGSTPTTAAPGKKSNNKKQTPPKKKNEPKNSKKGTTKPADPTVPNAPDKKQ